MFTHTQGPVPRCPGQTFSGLDDGTQAVSMYRHVRHQMARSAQGRTHAMRQRSCDCLQGGQEWKHGYCIANEGKRPIHLITCELEADKVGKADPLPTPERHCAIACNVGAIEAEEDITLL